MKWKIKESDLKELDYIEWGIAGVDYHGSKLLMSHVMSTRFMCG